MRLQKRKIQKPWICRMNGSVWKIGAAWSGNRYMSGMPNDEILSDAEGNPIVEMEQVPVFEERDNHVM